MNSNQSSLTPLIPGKLNTDIKKRLLRGSIWTVMGRAVGIGAGLVINVLLARLLTPEDMGAYFLTISVVLVAALIAQVGLPTAIVRLIAESLGKGDGGRARMTIKLSIVLCGLFSLIIAGSFYLGVGQWVASSIFESAPMKKVVGIATLLIIVITLQGLIVEIFRGFHDMRFTTLFGGMTTSLFSAIAFGLIWMLQGHAELKDILLLSLGAWVLSFLIAVLMLPPKFSLLCGGGDIDSKSLLKISMPMGVVALTIFVATQGDLWVVGAFLPENQAAVYGAVLRLVMLMTMTHSLVVSIVQSTIAEMYGQDDIKQMERLVQGSAFIACVPAFIILMIYVVFGHELMAILFGEFYRDGYWPLLIICVTQFIGMLFGSTEMVLLMTGYQTHLMKLMLVTATIGLLLAVWLVMLYGLIGVAIAWGAGSVLQGIGSWMLVKRKLNIKCQASIISISVLKEAVLCK